jgi:hypothetical protein
VRIAADIALVIALTFVPQLKAASAVTLGVGRDGKPYWTYWKDPKNTETAVQSRAIEMAHLAGARNVRVIASTSKLGFGCILMFLRMDNKLDYTVALAAPTWDAAVNEAKRKAKSLGGRAFKVARGWNDGIRTNQPIIMQKL